MALEEYTFLVTQLLTGNVIDEVELQSFHWNELYNRPGSAQATARVDDRTATRTNYASWQNGLWIRQGDEILWGGYMGSVSPISGTRALQIPVFGFEEYFRTRFLRSIQGMTNANVSYSGIQWTNKDIFLIAKDMITHAQSFATGDLGVVVDYGALSGTITSQTYYAYEFKPVGVAFEQLADNIAGFDWRYRFDWSGSKPRCTIWLSPVPQGRRTQFVLELDHNPGKTNLQSLDSESSTPPVNGVAAAGSGEGDAMLKSYVSDLGTGYPLFEGMVSYKDVTQQATLDNHAYKHLARNKVPQANLTVSIASDGEPKHNEFICGDELFVKVDDGWNQYAAYYRVSSKEMLLSKTHDMELKVGLSVV
jgi:hypothetical protein